MIKDIKKSMVTNILVQKKYIIKNMRLLGVRVISLCSPTRVVGIQTFKLFLSIAGNNDKKTSSAVQQLLQTSTTHAGLSHSCQKHNHHFRNNINYSWFAL
jgi:acetylglutamate synthase